MSEWEAAVAALIAACRRLSAETSGKGVRGTFARDDRLNLAGIEGALARIDAAERAAGLCKSDVNYSDPMPGPAPASLKSSENMRAPMRTPPADPAQGALL